MTYEDRVIAYCDILAWSDAIERSVKCTAFLEKLDFATRWSASPGQLLHFFGGTSSGLQITHFSDTVIFSCPVDAAEGFSTVAWRVFELVHGLLTAGEFLTRGAIVVGQLYHRENIVFGPALLKAYKLESKAAVYPRILVDEDVLSSCRADGKGLDIQRVKRDFDGFYYLDTLRIFAPLGPLIDPGRYVGFEHYLHRCREITIENIHKCHFDIKKLKKWRWLARYFNKVVNEYPNFGIKKIMTLPK